MTRRIRQSQTLIEYGCLLLKLSFHFPDVALNYSIEFKHSWDKISSSIKLLVILLVVAHLQMT